MSAVIPRYSLRLAVVFFAGSVAVEIVNAQDSRTDTRGSFGVPLQPFSLRETADASPRAEPIRVAYYAPRSQPALAPRAESVADEDDLEATNAFPEINSNRPMVAGDRAILRNGIAYAPSQAPDNIKNAIWAVNTLRRKPYVWGGGHGSFNDYGYDCSGAVSFALHYAGLLDAPLPSSDLCHYGRRGRGRWITIYSRNGHTFAIIAGLRLDTTDMRDGGAVGPRWYADGRDTHDFDARHPAGW
jgi:hypothetical protein